MCGCELFSWRRCTAGRIAELGKLRYKTLAAAKHSRPGFNTDTQPTWISNKWRICINTTSNKLKVDLPKTKFIANPAQSSRAKIWSSCKYMFGGNGGYKTKTASQCRSCVGNRMEEVFLGSADKYAPRPRAACRAAAACTTLLCTFLLCGGQIAKKCITYTHFASTHRLFNVYTFPPVPMLFTFTHAPLVEAALIFRVLQAIYFQNTFGSASES